MCDHSDLNRRLDEIRDDLRDFISVNEQHHDEVFTRVRKLEIALATARGAKAGVIFSFSFLWALLLAVLAGIWNWVTK